MGGLELREQDVRFGLRLGHGHAGLQASHEGKGVPPVANFIHDGRNIKVEFCSGCEYRAEIECGGQYADHSHGLLAQTDPLTDNRGVSGELTLPEGVAQKGRGPAALLALFRRELPAQYWLDAESWKEICGHHDGGNGLRFAAAGQRVFTVAQERIVAGQLLERVIVALEFFVRRHGVSDAGEAARIASLSDGFAAGGQPGELMSAGKR